MQEPRLSSRQEILLKKKIKIFILFSADLSTAQGTQKIVEEILNQFGKLDILINNFGGSETKGGGFSVLKDEDWLQSLQTNLLSPGKIRPWFFTSDD